MSVKPYNWARVLEASPIEVNRELVKIQQAHNAETRTESATSVAAGATTVLAPTTAQGLLTIAEVGGSGNGAALYLLHAGIVALIAPTGGNWAATAGGASFGVYVSGSEFRLQNNLAGAREFRWDVSPRLS